MRRFEARSGIPSSLKVPCISVSQAKARIDRLAIITMIDLNDDEIIQEIDIVVAPELSTSGSGSMLDEQLKPMVLQFPLRQKDRPYETGAGNPRVKYKFDVKRMHWDIPLDVDGHHYYDADFDERKQISHFSLKSSRVHQGIGGTCVGLLKDNTLHLIPVQEVMQLRPSPHHLDKHGKESVSLKDGSVKTARDALFAENGRRNDLQPITVQIKKHETEQQTEARLRSYAFHAQKDEADPWCDLSYCGEQSGESAAVWSQIENSMAEPIEEETYLNKREYLDALIGSASMALSVPALHTETMQDNRGKVGGLHSETAYDIGKPAQNIPMKGHVKLEDSIMMDVSAELSTDSTTSLKTTLDRLFEESAVLSLSRIRKSLKKPHMTDQLQEIAHRSSDEELHACIMTLNRYIHLRNSYVRQLKGDSILDPLRSIVVDILHENEVIKRSDVMDKANELGVAVTDNMYSRVMKELCVSKGALWSMKSGD